MSSTSVAECSSMKSIFSCFLAKVLWRRIIFSTRAWSGGTVSDTWISCWGGAGVVTDKFDLKRKSKGSIYTDWKSAHLCTYSKPLSLIGLRAFFPIASQREVFFTSGLGMSFRKWVPTVCFLDKWPQTKCKVTFDNCLWLSFSGSFTWLPWFYSPWFLIG